MQVNENLLSLTDKMIISTTCYGGVKMILVEGGIMKKSRDTRIGIIGAGAAGLSAAYFLKGKGYRNITVLERENYIGGMCCSPVIYGQANDMGALEVTPDYENLLELIEEFDCEMLPVPEVILIDAANGRQYPLKELLDGLDMGDILLAIGKYFYELLRHSDSLRKPGFRDISPELAKPFSQWLDDHNMGCLKRLFSIPVSCYGYGYIDEVPAAYVMKYMDYKNFATVLYVFGFEYVGFEPHWPKMLRNGLQDLMEQIAGTLPDVRKNITVKQVRRNAGGTGPIEVDVEYKENGTTETLVFDELILAIQQETSLLQFMDLTDTEKALFDKVRFNNYFTTACEVKDFTHNGFAELMRNGEIVLPENGYPFILVKIWEESDIMVVYSYGDNSLTVDDIQERLKKHVADIGRELVKIHETRQWNYFPHVSSEDIGAGFYDDFEKLQGQNSTYYTGGVANFELVENVIAYSKDLVKRFF